MWHTGAGGTLSTQIFSHTEVGCKSMGRRETGRRGKLFSSFPLGALWPAGRTYLALLDASFSPFYPSHALQQATSSKSRNRGEECLPDRQQVPAKWESFPTSSVLSSCSVIEEVGSARAMTRHRRSVSFMVPRWQSQWILQETTAHHLQAVCAKQSSLSVNFLSFLL